MSKRKDERVTKSLYEAVTFLLYEHINYKRGHGNAEPKDTAAIAERLAKNLANESASDSQEKDQVKEP